MAATYHLIPGRDSGWILKKEGEATDQGRFPTREEALRVARTLCDTVRAELVIHHSDGTVSRK